MEELSNRQKALLTAIVEGYVLSAKPVGSKVLAEEQSFDVSPATIRNEMKALEDLGLITHPHTSAGRMPTEAGYRYYVEQFVLQTKQHNKYIAKQVEHLMQGVKTENPEITLKQLAKGLAELSAEAILVRLGEHNFFYTGISNMFAKPEFRDIEVMYSLSELIDHFDEALDQLAVKDEIDILIGSSNPISKFCSAIIIETQYIQPNNSAVIAILGPMRMNYQRNYQLLQHTKQVLTMQPYE